MTSSTNLPASETETDTQPDPQNAESLLDKARIHAGFGRVQEAFQCGTEALLLRPGDVGILSFISGLNYMPKGNPPQPALQTNPCFTTSSVKNWPMGYYGGHPQRYEHNYSKYLARGGKVEPGVDVRVFTSVDGAEDEARRADMSRFYFFCLVFDQIAKEGLQGNFAELGVNKGHTAALLATFARRIGTTAYLLDTFEGFSTQDLQGIDAGREIEFADTSLEKVREWVGEDNVTYIKGFFPASAVQMSDDLLFSLVHIDCDLYAPARSALEYFYPRMVPGGFIIIHDYHSLYWDGLEQAVDEFFADKPESLVPVPDACGSVVVRTHRQPLSPGAISQKQPDAR